MALVPKPSPNMAEYGTSDVQLYQRRWPRILVNIWYFLLSPSTSAARNSSDVGEIVQEFFMIVRLPYGVFVPIQRNEV
jgi:hypothetical protein